MNTPHGSRLSRDAYFTSMARLVAQRATCLRRAVGCVLTNEHGHVLATGYNGVASGQPHCNDVVEEPNPVLMVRRLEHWENSVIRKYPHKCDGADAPSGTALHSCKAIHAEQNALLQCRNINEIHTAYVTVSPCVQCMRLLANTSVKRIVYTEEYPHVESRSIAVGRGIVWDHYRAT